MRPELRPARADRGFALFARRRRRATKLYDRTKERLTQDEVERTRALDGIP